MITTTKYLRKLEEKNKKFAKANKAAKRVMIAKDVLEQLQAKRIVAKKGTYCTFKLNEVRTIKKSDNKSVRENFHNGAITSCKTCGIGAIMLSTILFKNGINVQHNIQFASVWNDSDTDQQATALVLKYFDEQQLRLIEAAFECWSVRRFVNDQLLAEQASNFGALFSSPTKRLKAIMENIIRNKGTFVPGDYK